jgi:hypothetical protein
VKRSPTRLRNGARYPRRDLTKPQRSHDKHYAAKAWYWGYPEMWQYRIYAGVYDPANNAYVTLEQTRRIFRRVQRVGGKRYAELQRKYPRFDRGTTGP